MSGRSCTSSAGRPRLGKERAELADVGGCTSSAIPPCFPSACESGRCQSCFRPFWIKRLQRRAWLSLSCLNHAIANGEALFRGGAPAETLADESLDVGSRLEVAALYAPAAADPAECDPSIPAPERHARKRLRRGAQACSSIWISVIAASVGFPRAPFASRRPRIPAKR